MESVFHVMVMLRNPSFAEGEEDFLNVNLMFDRQPSVDDVLDAFLEEPQLTKRKDFGKYNAVLIDGLNTYGVPLLRRHRMVESDGYHLAVPRVCAKWYMNIVGRTTAESDVHYGSISISERRVHETEEAPIKTGASARSQSKEGYQINEDRFTKE